MAVVQVYNSSMTAGEWAQLRQEEIKHIEDKLNAAGKRQRSRGKSTVLQHMPKPREAIRAALIANVAAFSKRKACFGGSARLGNRACLLPVQRRWSGGCRSTTRASRARRSAFRSTRRAALVGIRWRNGPSGPRLSCFFPIGAIHAL